MPGHCLKNACPEKCYLYCPPPFRTLPLETHRRGTAKLAHSVYQLSPPLHLSLPLHLLPPLNMCCTTLYALHSVRVILYMRSTLYAFYSVCVLFVCHTPEPCRCNGLNVTVHCTPRVPNGRGGRGGEEKERRGGRGERGEDGERAKKREEREKGGSGRLV